MTRNRSRRTIIAAIIALPWLAYMVVGLALINVVAPTQGGEGPEGFAAFIGLIWGVVACGAVMWAASED